MLAEIGQDARIGGLAKAGHYAQNPLLFLLNAESDLRSFGEVRDLAVQVSKKGDVLVEVSNVGCIRRTAFGKTSGTPKPMH